MDFYEFEDYPKRGNRRGGGFFQGLIGAVIGGLLVLMLLPSLVKWGYLDIPSANSERADSGRQAAANESTTPPQVDVDVTSNVVDAVAKVENSVVGVVNLQKTYDFWSRPVDVVPAGTGSGVIIDRKGDTVFIVTNHHVIDGAEQVEVVLANGERVKANIKGSDPITDLAVLTIVAPQDFEIKPVQFGNSDRLKSGEPAIAIGNPLGLRFSRTVTQGVISSTERSIPYDLDGDGTTDWEMDVIQTDAAINPGNSGGALINIAGQLIGINSAKISQSGVEGMGFAIPINDAIPVIDDLIRYGYVKRAIMGIAPKNLQEVNTYHWTNTLKLPDNVHAGVIVMEVTPGGPADKAGMKRLDVIVKLDGQEINDAADLRKYLYKNKEPGDRLEVTFYRDGQLKTVTLTLEESNPLQ